MYQIFFKKKPTLFLQTATLVFKLLRFFKVSVTFFENRHLSYLGVSTFWRRGRISECHIFWNINVFPEYGRFSAKSDYHRVFKCAVLLNINVFPTPEYQSQGLDRQADSLDAQLCPIFGIL